MIIINYKLLNKIRNHNSMLMQMNERRSKVSYLHRGMWTNKSRKKDGVRKSYIVKLNAKILNKNGIFI